MLATYELNCARQDSTVINRQRIREEHLVKALTKGSWEAGGWSWSVRIWTSSLRRDHMISGHGRTDGRSAEKDRLHFAINLKHTQSNMYKLKEERLRFFLWPVHLVAIEFAGQGPSSKTTTAPTTLFQRAPILIKAHHRAEMSTKLQYRGVSKRIQQCSNTTPSNLHKYKAASIKRNYQRAITSHIYLSPLTFENTRSNQHIY